MHFSTVCYLLFGLTLNVALSARLDLLQFFRSFDGDELKSLIDSGKYDINHQNPQGNTVIHDLVKSCVELKITPFSKNTSAIIDLIYTHFPSINVNLENEEGQTFLDIAAAPTIDDSRLTAYQNTRILLSTILKKDILKKDFENVNRAFFNSPEELRVLFLKQKAFKGDLPINGKYPLTTAMKSLSVELVEELLDLPEVNVNIKDIDGNTPILSMMTADHYGKYGYLYNMKFVP